MSNFKIGDKVYSDDGSHGVIVKIKHPEDLAVVEFEGDREGWIASVPLTMLKYAEKPTNGFKENSLVNWTIREVCGGYAICGTIYNDTKNRFEDGTVVRTSRLDEINFVTKVAKTKNSIYNLE